MPPRSRASACNWAPALLALLAALAASGVWAQDKKDEKAAPADDPPAVVKLTVDYGDGVEKRFKALEWRPGLTALEALEQAAAHKRGVKLKHRGAGQTAFIEAIDDLENEGGGGRNWLYQINGERAKRGAGVSPLAAGDEVLWTFGPMR